MRDMGANAPHDMSKYHNVKTIVDGNTFDSKAEAQRYQELKLLEKAKLIWALKLQPRYVLAPPCILDGRKKPGLTYVADFEYIADGSYMHTVEDVKGAVTAVYRIKRHLMKTVLGLDIVEIKK
jgi:hypothetical protein